MAPLFLSVVVLSAAAVWLLYDTRPGYFRQNYRATARLTVADRGATFRAGHMGRLRTPGMRVALAAELGVPPDILPRIRILPGGRDDDILLIAEGPEPGTPVRTVNVLARIYVENRRDAQKKAQAVALEPARRECQLTHRHRLAAEADLERRLRRPLRPQENLARLPRRHRNEVFEVLEARRQEAAAILRYSALKRELLAQPPLVKIAQRADNASVDAPARGPWTVKRIAGYAAGGLAGLVGITGFITLGLTLFSGARARRIESVSQGKKMLQLTSLAELPPTDMGAEALRAAYDDLFQEIIYQMPQGFQKGKTLAITSALPAEGRSSVAANIAMAAARRGHSVLLVDADIRAPVQHLAFGGADAKPAPGLLNLIEGAHVLPTEALRTTPVERLRLLAAGTTEGNANDLFSSRKMEQFLRGIAPKLADLVVFDAPHLLSNEPGRKLLPQVDAVVYVVRLESTDANKAKKALEVLTQKSAPIIGAAYVPAGDFPLALSIPLPRAGEAPALSEPTDEIPLAIRREPTIPLHEPSDDAEETTDVLDVARPEPTQPLATPPGEDLKITPGSTEIETDDGACADASPPENAETDEGRMNNAHPTDASSATADPEGGPQDLESVLQGWRRRDYTAGGNAPPTPPSQVATAPVPTPAEETEPDAVAGTGMPAGAAAPEALGVPFFNDTVPFGIPSPLPTAAPGETTPEDPEALSLADITAAIVDMIEITPETAPPAAEETVEAIALNAPPPLAAEASVPPADLTVELPLPAAEPDLPARETPKAEALPPTAAEPALSAPALAEAAEPIAVIEEPAPERIAIPVQTAPLPPIPSPFPAAAPASPPASVAAPAPQPAAPAATPAAGQALEMQIEMFPAGPGEMTLRATTANAATLNVPHVVLEMTTQMQAMRGMRVVTPTNLDPETPRIALETSTADTVDAARMRVVVGDDASPAFEAALRTQEAISVRTGGGSHQPRIHLELGSANDGGARLRATLAGNGPEVVVEMSREAADDSATGARWRNRLAIYSRP